MTPRFLADADLNHLIVEGVTRREPSIDFQSAQSVGLEGVPDPEVLAAASQARRILISHDFDTMPRHFYNFLALHESPGVFLISQGVPIGVAVEELVMIWAASDSDEWKGKLTYVPL